jgi:UDP-N-acetylmuramate dehydrogenase
MSASLKKQLEAFGHVRANEPLAKHTTFKIGGPAQFFITILETERLVALLQFLQGEGIPYSIIGGGSNMLASDEGFQGVVIQIKTQKSQVLLSPESNTAQLFAEAGCATVAIAQLSMQHALTGFEWGVGVPGTIGGAVRGNAGAMGSEMKDNVQSVSVFRDGEVIELTNSDCLFGYRDSLFKHNSDVILSTVISLQKAHTGGTMKQALEYLHYRNKTQPQGFASTGCIFKNIETTKISPKVKDALLHAFPEDAQKIEQFFVTGKISAGWLIEKSDMKGFDCGQAKVSETHGNFVVNAGGATAHDVLSLIEQIKEKVYAKTNIPIEEEIQII